jgi:hypothetical protein
MTQKFGPTGNRPFPAIDETDDGEIALGVASDPANGTVIIQFGTPVAWIGLYPAQAKQIAETLIRHADALLGGAQ